nr:transporter substrate-binding domain-containing protein [Corynebacterium capitovis]
MGVVALSLSTVALTACGSIPADPDGTYNRAENGTLVVGVSENNPWTDVDDSGSVSGTEADLVRGFAESIDADIEWKTASESVLVDWMDHGEVDVMIGGLTSTSPWSSKIALTRGYTTVDNEDGKKEKMVMAVPMGENKLLVELERFLAREEGEI